MADIDALGDDTVAPLLSCMTVASLPIAGAHGEAAAGIRLVHRPPGALRRFEQLQRRVVQLGKWRIAVPFTGSAHRVHPFLGLWAIAIVAALTFAAARTNFVLLRFYSKESRPTLRSALHRG